MGGKLTLHFQLGTQHSFFQRLDARFVAVAELLDLLADLHQIGAVGGLRGERRGQGERNARHKGITFKQG